MQVQWVVGGECAGSVGMQRQDGERVSKGELINRLIVGGEMGCVF